MSSMGQFISISLIALCIGLRCAGASAVTACDQTENVNFISHDIFNLADDETIFVHRWANFLHLKTQLNTLLNESAFFLRKCQINPENLAELERHLRGQKYLRKASVKYDEEQRVIVETWDNWSLMPTVDIGRKGGKNKYSLGIKDRNLFGLAIDAEIEYFNNDQRSGYKFDTQFPLFLGNNTQASIRLTDNDDGSSQALLFHKSFVSFDTGYAYKLGFDNFKQIDTQYAGGFESNRYLHKQRYATAGGYWLHQDTATDTLRFGLGYTSESHSFSGLPAPDSMQTKRLPTDRQFDYPFATIEYLQKDYRKLKNLNLINQIEDFNLGWDVTAELGTEVSHNVGSATLIWLSNASKGLDVGDHAFLFFAAGFAGEFYANRQLENRLLLSLTTEYFYPVNNRWGAYFKNANQISQNQYIDAPVVLGGETGVRGFPLQYQHGQHSTQFTLEARYYPHINLYKLVELGAAVFVDSGRVFAQSEPSHPLLPWMTSVGLGGRFYSTHSSDARVIHLDLIKPITSDPNVNSIEIRLTTKNSF